jgi:hypothetical protein
VVREEEKKGGKGRKPRSFNGRAKEGKRQQHNTSPSSAEGSRRARALLAVKGK